MPSLSRRRTLTAAGSLLFASAGCLSLSSAESVRADLLLINETPVEQELHVQIHAEDVPRVFKQRYTLAPATERGPSERRVNDALEAGSYHATGSVGMHHADAHHDTACAPSGEESQIVYTFSEDTLRIEGVECDESDSP